MSGRRILVIAILCLASAATLANAQPTTNVSIQIVALERESMEGWMHGNPEPMLSKMDPQITYIHEIFGKRLEGIIAVKQMCEPYRGRPLFDSFELDAPKVRVSGSTAVLSYTLVTHNGATVSRWNTTQVYERITAGWRVIHTHISQPPAAATQP